MRALAANPEVYFIGQSVAYDGATIYDSLDGVPIYKRIEMPVIEDFQMGLSIGLAMRGFVPVSIYPRIDFLLLALNQLVNHLDKMPQFGWRPKVIVRTRIGSWWPLNAGPQHTQNHAIPISQMLEWVKVRQVVTADEVVEAYREAYNDTNSWVIVECPTTKSR